MGETHVVLAIGSNNVHIIGVWETGGMGKTTLARIVFRMVSNKFEGCCFPNNVGEVSKKDGLVPLQQQLITQILDKSMSMQDIDIGVLMLKNKLRHKKILLVLDDVSEFYQLKKLIGEHDWFGPGSRVIIATRDMHLLETHEVDAIYEVERLNYDEALHLSNLKAFGKENPIEVYLQLSQAFVHYTNGLPLAIEVLGTFLFNKSRYEWISELHRLKKFPKRNILNILQIRFDGLQAIEKEIFLNIGCFLNHKNQESIMNVLNYLLFYPKIGLRVLIDKSLINCITNNYGCEIQYKKWLGTKFVRSPL